MATPVCGIPGSMNCRLFWLCNMVASALPLRTPIKYSLPPMVTPACYEEDRIDFATPVGPYYFPPVFQKWLSLSHRLGLDSTLTILSHSDSFTSSFHLFIHTGVLHFLVRSLTHPLL